MCARGPQPGSSSSVPMGTPARPRSGFSNGRVDPQTEQKQCVNRSASGGLKDRTR